MPTTVGHAIAGAVAAWTADLIPGQRAWRTAHPTAGWYQRAGDGLTLVCATLGALPDADLLFHIHRSFSHSIGAVIFVTIFAAAMAANAGRPIARIALMCGAAYATHLVLDWMAVDRYPPRGIQAFWPVSRAYFISGWDLFQQTERHAVLSWPTLQVNAHAIVRELAILVPPAIVVWILRGRTLRQYL